MSRHTIQKGIKMAVAIMLLQGAAYTKPSSDMQHSKCELAYLGGLIIKTEN